MFARAMPRAGGREALCVLEGYRDAQGRSRQRVVENLGYRDELDKAFGDSWAYAQRRALELTEQRAEENASIVIEFHPAEKIDMRKQSCVNLGCAVISRFYHLLSIDRFWANRKMRGKFKWDPNSVFRMLVYSRIIEPSSKADAWAKRERIPERTGFTDDDMYRCLSFFAGYERDLVEWIAEKTSVLSKPADEVVYYDVTNYYFEIDQEDDLRRRGVSKEHRPNPIVQMGLVLDSTGMPLDYQLFEGNTNDCLTLLPVLKDMRKRHGAKRIVVVADKGLNTSDNIAANAVDGNGFVFSQTVSGACAGLKEWILDRSGYSGDEHFKVKDRIGQKTVYIAGTDGKTTRIPVTVREVAFWSKDFAERSAHERSKVVEKSLAAVKRGGGKAAKAHSALRYVNDIAVVKETGELAEHVLELDEDKIMREAETDGYYCIITSEVEKSAGEVIEIYKGLWRIEESFRVMKSTIKARPVYLSRHDRIHAHFLVCYVALVITRLIQIGLGWQHSAEAVAYDLAHMNGHRMDKNHFLFSYRTPLCDELGKIAGVDLSKKTMSAGGIRSLMSETKRN
jgi:hypothetical protein